MGEWQDRGTRATSGSLELRSPAHQPYLGTQVLDQGSLACHHLPCLTQLGLGRLSRGALALQPRRRSRAAIGRRVLIGLALQRLQLLETPAALALGDLERLLAISQLSSQAVGTLTHRPRFACVAAAVCRQFLLGGAGARLQLPGGSLGSRQLLRQLLPLQALKPGLAQRSCNALLPARRLQVGQGRQRNGAACSLSSRHCLLAGLAAGRRAAAAAAAPHLVQQALLQQPHLHTLHCLVPPELFPSLFQLCSQPPALLLRCLQVAQRTLLHVAHPGSCLGAAAFLRRGHGRRSRRLGLLLQRLAPRLSLLAQRCQLLLVMHGLALQLVLVLTLGRQQLRLQGHALAAGRLQGCLCLAQLCSLLLAHRLRVQQLGLQPVAQLPHCRLVALAAHQGGPAASRRSCTVLLCHCCRRLQPQQPNLQVFCRRQQPGQVCIKGGLARGLLVAMPLNLAMQCLQLGQQAALHLGR